MNEESATKAIRSDQMLCWTTYVARYGEGSYWIQWTHRGGGFRQFDRLPDLIKGMKAITPLSNWELY